MEDNRFVESFCLNDNMQLIAKTLSIFLVYVTFVSSANSFTFKHFTAYNQQ